MPGRASEVAAALGAALEGPDVTLDGVGIDTRTLRQGALFVPLVAVRDGHDFIAAAAAAGAAAYVTARGRSEPDVALPALLVDDTAAALTRLGVHRRKQHAGEVIGITGSVGKTSVKDLTAAALTSALRVAASERSFNNELGVPLTIANAAADTEVLVLELGARGHGHIRALCDVARPTIGVVTTVAAAHTEQFGGVEAIAEAKGELVEALPSSGTAILAAEVPVVAAMARRTAASVLRFGRGGDVWAEDVVLDEQLRPSFSLHSPWGRTLVRLEVHGEHQVANALAAASAALVCEVPLDAVAAGLQAAVVSPWRMELSTTARGTRVLNDAYNANPTSMAAGLQALARLPATRRFAVLGPMAELGQQSDAEHRAVAALASSLAIELVPYGTDAYGAPALDDLDAICARLGHLTADDAVLVKGSRVAGLERVADLLLGRG